ncbi:GNAT family N-acetyltransferase [Serpentinicella alkaliphila]|uniref:Putative N-acetyltransferase YhbS n=1 Tax=Serpentinicella alkaliphila TaxID=1734049 RepID=A0A4R2TJH1_9FIRM|nr:N-acetyltransferase [Serpentinicella alkaliphila]QUH26608.1 N-acetyltransferase [Serpentinicella alkaliphila]TCQ02926.1 putative N-acetyltransferase YhbS [Serpentinicella alkaliphila]
MHNIIIRNEIPLDYRVVEELTREAFWNHHVPGCDEHYLLHIMRNADSFIRELDFVAEIDGKIVGNIVYTKSKIIDDKDECYDVITFGPLSVVPQFQGKGIGRMLIEYTKELAKELGYRAILIYGDPNYYSKFGFVEAEKYDIRTPDNIYAVPLQALELYQGALSDCGGRFFEDSLFVIDRAASLEFDKNFPQKDKLNGLPTQERFIQLINMRKVRE